MLFNRTAHIELWIWLAENFPAEKRDWPGWVRNGGDYKEEVNGINCHCFACNYAEAVRLEENTISMDRVCTLCPLMPEGNIAMMRFHVPGCLEGLYEKYDQCIEETGEAREMSDDVRRARGIGLARMIAYLPVRNGVCYE